MATKKGTKGRAAAAKKPRSTKTKGTAKKK